jgi:NADH:ubiquinone oxidoreductase subunit 6 (subunit J)
MIKQMRRVLGTCGATLVLGALGLLLSLLAIAGVGIAKTWGGGTWHFPAPIWIVPAVMAYCITVVITIPLLALRTNSREGAECPKK